MDPRAGRRLPCPAHHPGLGGGGRGGARPPPCEAWTELGVEEAFLEIRADNQAALRLYAELGWETAGTRTSYYRDGTDAVVMRWQAIPGGR